MVVGARSEGLRVSLLGGAAWTLIPFSGYGNTRTGAGSGGGAFVEVIHLWRVAPAWTIGFGGTLWGIFGSDRVKWLGDPTEPTWNNLGGALLATVSTR